ncbi:hypothetical protein, partial [Marinitenerispora sediminis]|uniref:hypothetical protein n=1 Tax=Marinitenerispora sediminis TaxID=1931232 RepID=UPI000E04B90B
MTDPGGHGDVEGRGAVGGPVPGPGYPRTAGPEEPPAWWDIADRLWLAAQHAALAGDGAPRG